MSKTKEVVILYPAHVMTDQIATLPGAQKGRKKEAAGLTKESIRAIAKAVKKQLLSTKISISNERLKIKDPSPLLPLLNF